MYTTWPNLTWSRHEQFTWGEFFGEFPILNDIIQSRVRIHHERFNIFFASFFFMRKNYLWAGKYQRKNLLYFSNIDFLGYIFLFYSLFLCNSFFFLFRVLYDDFDFVNLDDVDFVIEDRRFSRDPFFFSVGSIFFFQFQFNSQIFSIEWKPAVDHNGIDGEKKSKLRL